MKWWSKHAGRVPLLFDDNKDLDTSKSGLREAPNDLSRPLFFKANPNWAIGVQNAVQYAMSFARRYAERDDHEVSGLALSAVVSINQQYIAAKGKAFFSNSPLIDNPLSTDGFINNTLEHLRQNIQIGIARHDEQQLEQTLRTLGALVKVYVHITYVEEYAEKSHAHIAVAYLEGAAEAILPHNMVDVMMEGIRIMGDSAEYILTHVKALDVIVLVDKIGLLGSATVVTDTSRAITLVAVEQLTKLTLILLRSKSSNIDFVGNHLKDNVAMIAQVYLQTVPDKDLLNVHHSTLAPYYSSTSLQGLVISLTEITNAITQRKVGDKDAQVVLGNIAKWSDGLFVTAKEVLLKAIEKRSHFTFDIIQWIGDVTKILIILSRAPACEKQTEEQLRRNATWLICVLSWIPDTSEAILWTENYEVVEIMFEAALTALATGEKQFAKAIGELLFEWAFKAGKYSAGRLTLIDALHALATIAVIPNSWLDPRDIKQRVSQYLTQGGAPSPKIRQATAKYIREAMQSFSHREDSFSRIRHQMHRVDQAQLHGLLADLADLLSPAP